MISATRISRVLRRKALIIPAAILALAIVAAATAASTSYFGGGDAAVKQAQTTAFTSSPVTHDGITISVTGVAADDTETLIGLDIEGRSDIGAGAMPAGQANLVDGSGRIYSENAGTADQSNPRLVTRYYPALASGVTSFTIEINGLEFMTSGQHSGTRVDDEWSIPVTLASPPAKSAVVAIDTASQPFGPGSITVDRVQQGPTGTVISAHLSGYSMDEIPVLGFDASLTGPDGQSMQPVEFRAGFGTDRQQLEIRFANTSGTVKLNLSGKVDDPHPQNPTLSAKLAKEFAATAPATWSFTLP
ncbi:MAG TPA: hypothetical protein VJQ83_09700 [Tepidiformaceae bacterium]|nr:hypothetical protein [Tepidiformaceae bacterium]